MVICKFFLQGNCRFGESCRFEHQLNSRTNQNYSSVFRKENFSPNTNNPRNIDLNTLVQSVSNDMISSEKGGQWLLTCYSPCKEKPNMPGLEDQSFEEVRFGYYTARALGTLDQFVQQFQIAQQAAATVIRSLQNPTPDAISTISSIYNSTPNNSNSNTFLNSNSSGFTQSNNVSGGLFGAQKQAQTAPSIFATANQQIFGEAQTQQNSIFGGNTNVFNGTQQQNTFVQQSNFNAQPQQSDFGSGNPQQSGFPPSNFSFIGQATNQQPPAFVNQLPAQNTSIFNSQPTQPNVGFNFNGQPGANSTIFNPQQNNVQQQSVFANSAPTGQIQQFQPTAAQPINMFGNVNTNVNDDSVYSKIEDLSESDIQSFQSAAFEFGKIPEKPPTKEMCF